MLSTTTHLGVSAQSNVPAFCSAQGDAACTLSGSLSPWTLAAILCVFSIGACPLAGMAQSSPAGNSQLAMRLSLELKKQGHWQRVDPKTVFHSGDAIRFRFVTSLGGFLYVMNRSSDGDASWLFPLSREGTTSRVEPGPDYLVPGTKGSFVVGGKAGFDVTYWILSPAPMDVSETTLPAPGSQPSTLEPRCRAELLQARGLCIDERAGPRPFRQNGQAPPLGALEGKTLVSRELKFQSQNDSTRISLAGSGSGVIVYEFLIAHN